MEPEPREDGSHAAVVLLFTHDGEGWLGDRSAAAFSPGMLAVDIARAVAFACRAASAWLAVVTLPRSDSVRRCGIGILISSEILA